MRWMLSVLLLLVQACATAPQKPSLDKISEAQEHTNETKSDAMEKPAQKVEVQSGLKLKQTIKHDPKLPSEFFAISKGSLVLGVYYEEEKSKEGDSFQVWLKDKRLFRRTEPVESLASLGFKKGDVIQYLNYETNRVNQYELKDKVNLIMIDYENRPEGDSRPYRTVHLWLNDVPEKNNFRDRSNFDEVTGIAYKGSEYSLLPNNLNYVPEHARIVIDDQEVQDIYAVLKESLSPEKRELHLVEARVREVGPVTDFLYLLDDNDIIPHATRYSRYVETVVRVGGDSVYNVSFYDREYKSRIVDGELDYKNILDGADMVFFEEEDSYADICLSLFVVKGDVIKQHYLKCQSENK